MRRIAVAPRENLYARAKELGFDFFQFDGQPYWDESVYYAFSLREIEDDIEAPTNELAALCLELVDRIAGDQRALERLKIPPHAWDLIAEVLAAQGPELIWKVRLRVSWQRTRQTP